MAPSNPRASHFTTGLQRPADHDIAAGAAPDRKRTLMAQILVRTEEGAVSQRLPSVWTPRSFFCTLPWNVGSRPDSKLGTVLRAVHLVLANLQRL